jgi:hypothetical protein
MSKHVHCGGELSEYNPIEKELIILNKIRRKERLPEILYYVNRIKHTLQLKENNFYQCNKCNQKLRVISCPSYEDYLTMDYEKYLYTNSKVFFFSINMPKKCLVCGTENKRNIKKCRKCGHTLNRTVPEPKIITDTGRFGL